MLPCRALASSDAGGEEEKFEKGEESGSESDEFRRQMEGLMSRDRDDEAFDGRQLAAMVYRKYGRSYDVQLIKMEFLGRPLLAMNVMWKYREQKSFPLSKEQYLYRLDRVAENLRLWGAVNLVRESLARTKERPRMGKAVSIHINLDDTSARANEWIQR